MKGRVVSETIMLTQALQDESWGQVFGEKDGATQKGHSEIRYPGRVFFK